MLHNTKKPSIRVGSVGQAVSNSSVRKVGEQVKKPIFIKKLFKNIFDLKKSLKIFIFYIIYIIIWKKRISFLEKYTLTNVI